MATLDCTKRRNGIEIVDIYMHIQNYLYQEEEQRLKIELSPK